MPLEINYYDIGVHKLMLRDVVRCDAFRRALADVVSAGSVVLDIGAGSGLLSIFAAQAGASRVYAVERTKTAELAERIISDNGLSDRIIILQDDMANVELPEQVDVIVSEWLGGYGIDENLLPVIVKARDRYLKPEGSLIPRAVSSWIAPVHDPMLEQDMRFWTERPYGVDLAAIQRSTSGLLRCCCNHIKEEHVLADPRKMWEIDSAVTLEQSTREFEVDLRFTFRKDGCFNALAAWFVAQLSDGITLSNEPSEQYTHWGRWIFPIGDSLEIQEGESAAVRFRVTPQGPGKALAAWQVSTGEYSFSSEDLTYLTR